MKHLQLVTETLTINAHGATASAEEHESVLYHEDKMYDLIGAYNRDLDLLDSQQTDWYLRHIRHHINAILAYTGLDVDADCVMFECIDVMSVGAAA